MSADTFHFLTKLMNNIFSEMSCDFPRCLRNYFHIFSVLFIYSTNNFGTVSSLVLGLGDRQDRQAPSSHEAEILLEMS